MTSTAARGRPGRRDRPEPVRRLPRARRREQILAAATEAFARSGFAATSLDDIAAEAGITRVILYRHFDSKTGLYQAVLDRMCARLVARVEEPVGGFTDASIDGLLQAAVDSPAGFRLLFQHALREPPFPAPRTWKDQHHDGHCEGDSRRECDGAAEAGLGQGRVRL